MSRFVRATAALCLALAGFSLGSPARAAGETLESGHVVESGHVDIGPRLVDGEWRVQIRDDSSGEEIWREPDRTVLQVRDDSAADVPAGADFSFLGSAGSKVWLLPQVEQAGVVWPGWNTQDESVASSLDGPVDWVLHGVDGPGAFALFVSGEFGAPEVLFDTDEPQPQRMSVEPGTHAHGNWAFSAPGTYFLDTEMSGTVDGGAVSDRVVLRVHVGASVPTTAFSARAEPAASPGVVAPAAETGSGSGSEASGSGSGSEAESGSGVLLTAVGGGVALLGAGGVAAALLWRRRGVGLREGVVE